MERRILINNTPPEGFRWQVIEGANVLRTGTANTQLEAFIAANRAFKELDAERIVSATKQK